MEIQNNYTMYKNKRNKISKLLILLICFVFIGINYKEVKAYVITDNFDSYSVGDLGGQGSWINGTNGADIDVTTTQADTSPNSVHLNYVGGHVPEVYYPVTATTEGSFSFDFLSTATSGQGGGTIINFLHNTTQSQFDVSVKNSSSGCVKVFLKNSSIEASGCLTPNTWHHFSMSILLGQVYYTIDDSDVQSTSMTNTDTYNRIYIQNAVSATNSFYLDNFGSGTELVNSGSYFSAVSPSNGATISSSTVTTLGAIGRISGSDWAEGITGEIIYIKKTATGGCITAYEALFGCNGTETIYPFNDFWASGLTEGDPNGDEFVFSTTTPEILAEGDYNLIIKIYKPYLIFFKSQIIRSDTSFTVGAKTTTDIAFDSNTTELENILNYSSGTASTSCKIVSLDLAGCIYSIFIPDPTYIASSTSILYDSIKTHFPLGYVTEFIDIIATTSTTSIPVISATVPTGVVGAGAHIDLDINHQLDQFLNANIGTFANATASSTETLFEYTNRYWEYLIYILTAFYLLKRIFGEQFNHHKEKNDNKPSN